jgi:hypothetical protein
LPSLLNSVAGLVSTLVNVYSAQDGKHSPMSFDPGM